MHVAREWTLDRYRPVPQPPYRESARGYRPVEPARRRARPPLAAVGVAFLFWAFLVALGVLYVYREAGIIREGRQLQALRGAIEQVEEENRALEAQVASLSSIQRIDQEARRLGLVPPTEVKVAQVNRAAVMAAMATPQPEQPAPASQPTGLWDRVRGYVARWWARPAQEQASGR